MGSGDDSYDPYLHEEEERKARDQEAADRVKEEVGMAEPGTRRFYENARTVLIQFTQPNAYTQASLRNIEDRLREIKEAEDSWANYQD